MSERDETREELDREYREQVSEGNYDEYECVIVVKGRTAFEMRCAGESDMKYLFDNDGVYIQEKDIKSIKFYNKTQEKEKYALVVQRKVVGKGAFDKL